MKTAKEIIHGPPEDEINRTRYAEKIIEAIWERCKHNHRLIRDLVKEKNEDALQTLNSIPAAKSEEILLVYMEYEYLGEDGSQYVPTFRYFKRGDMENFCQIPAYDELCENGIDLIDFDEMPLTTLYKLDDIEIHPKSIRVWNRDEAPIKSWSPRELTAYINAPVFAQLGFSELDLAVELLLFYRGVNRNLDDGPPTKVVDWFQHLENKKYHLKSKLALYQMLKDVHAQLYT